MNRMPIVAFIDQMRILSKMSNDQLVLLANTAHAVLVERGADVSIVYETQEAEQVAETAPQQETPENMHFSSPANRCRRYTPEEIAMCEAVAEVWHDLLPAERSEAVQAVVAALDRSYGGVYYQIITRVKK